MKNVMNGTPLTTSPFISLGAGKNQIPIISKAKELGFNTIAIDINPNASGKNIADGFFVCSIHKPESIIDIIKKNNIKPIGIWSKSFGKSVISASIVAEYFSLPTLKSSIIKKLNNKITMRNLLYVKGISQPTFISRMEDLTILQPEKEYIFKPAVSHAKLGIIKTTGQYIQKNINQLILRSSEHIKSHKINNENKNEYLIEEYIDGDEITAILFGDGRSVKLIGVIDKITSKQNFIETGHIFPSKYSKDPLIQELPEICLKIGINFGPILVECIIKNKKLYIIEIIPEAGGEYIPEFIIPQGTGFDIIKGVIALYSNLTEISNKISLPEKYGFIGVKNYVLVKYFIIEHSTFMGLAESKELLNMARKKENGLFFYEFAKKGKSFKKSTSNLDRLGAIGLIAHNYDNLRSNLNNILKRIKIIVKQ